MHWAITIVVELRCAKTYFYAHARAFLYSTFISTNHFFRLRVCSVRFRSISSCSVCRVTCTDGSTRSTCLFIHTQIYLISTYRVHGWTTAYVVCKIITCNAVQNGCTYRRNPTPWKWNNKHLTDEESHRPIWLKWKKNLFRVGMLIHNLDKKRNIKIFPMITLFYLLKKCYLVY